MYLERSKQYTRKIRQLYNRMFLYCFCKNVICKWILPIVSYNFIFILSLNSYVIHISLKTPTTIVPQTEIKKQYNTN